MKGTRSQFGGKRGRKDRERSEKLQLKKTVHETKPFVINISLAHVKNV